MRTRSNSSGERGGVRSTAVNLNIWPNTKGESTSSRTRETVVCSNQKDNFKEEKERNNTETQREMNNKLFFYFNIFFKERFASFEVMIKKCCHSNETFKFQLEKPSLIFIFIQFFNQSQPFKLNPSSNHVHLQKYKYRKK